VQELPNVYQGKKKTKKEHPNIPNMPKKMFVMPNIKCYIYHVMVFLDCFDFLQEFLCTFGSVACIFHLDGFFMFRSVFLRVGHKS